MDLIREGYVHGDGLIRNLGRPDRPNHEPSPSAAALWRWVHEEVRRTDEEFQRYPDKVNSGAHADFLGNVIGVTHHAYGPHPCVYRTVAENADPGPCLTGRLVAEQIADWASAGPGYDEEWRP